ncbi:hypothetical protein CHT30_22940 [Salmonella enterica subsp. enterica serovar Infantis]|nr:hypothetical protein [Salmonella enterica subsp. enterica serovar Infantis]
MILYKTEFCGKLYFIAEVMGRLKESDAGSKNLLISFKDLTVIKCFSIDKNIEYKRISSKSKNITMIDTKEITTIEDKKDKEQIIKAIKRKLFKHIEETKNQYTKDIQEWERVKNELIK